MSKDIPTPADARGIDAVVRAFYERHPFKAISPALVEATGTPSGEPIPFDAFIKAGGDVAGLRRQVEDVIAVLRNAAPDIIASLPDSTGASSSGTDAVEIAAQAYAQATDYYVEFHRGLSSPSADKIRTGIRAALESISTPHPVEGAEAVKRDDIRRSIIRQLGDDPHADRIILTGTDWDIVLAALQHPGDEQKEVGV